MAIDAAERSANLPQPALGPVRARRAEANHARSARARSLPGPREPALFAENSDSLGSPEAVRPLAELTNGDARRPGGSAPAFGCSLTRRSRNQKGKARPKAHASLGFS